MASRAHSERSAGSVNRSGTLGQALIDHANQRVIHFFLFLFVLDAVCRRIRALDAGATITPLAIVNVKATHQVDTGFRSDDAGYFGFRADDPTIIAESATACGKTDAAHFCNLGVSPAGVAIIAHYIADPHVAGLFALVKMCAGDTRQLPQQVNIGPDRIIDMLHGRLAAEFFAAGTPVVSAANLKTYLAAATEAMTEYKADKVAKGRLGIAACCDAYLYVYANNGESIWQAITGQVWAECAARATALDRADYLAW